MSVLDIRKHTKYNWVDDSFPEIYIDDVTDVGEEVKDDERYIRNMIVASRLLGHAEEGKVSKIITFEKGPSGWVYSMSNVDKPIDVLEALAPLWHSAEMAAEMTAEEYDDAEE